MKRLLLLLSGWLFASVALASAPPARDRIEASMVITGVVEVAADGGVRAYTLDHVKRIPPLVVGVIAKTVAQWSFQPVLSDGKPVPAKAKMSLRVVAKPVDDKNFQVSVGDTYFGSRSSISLDMSTAPHYPNAALKDLVEGTVYLVLRIDRAGKVDDAVAQQVNLRATGSGPELKRWRKLFADASLKAARRWTYVPAAPGDAGFYRYVRVPLVYALTNVGEPVPYGQWSSYVPGPIEPLPWPTDEKLSAGNDALPEDGGVYGKPALTLLAPPSRG